PITAVFTVRGCDHQCVTCGASQAAFDRFMPGPHPLRRSPAAIAEAVQTLAALTRAPIFLVGDLRDSGEPYARAVVEALARRPVDNRLVFEFFAPPPDEFLARLEEALPHWGAEFSPESHAEAIRARLGKAQYPNARLEAALAACLRRRCEQLDLFYMIGLPGQTSASVLETVRAIEVLFQRFDRRLSAFITPLGPFIDPGSAGFETPAAHGYRLFARTLAEHRALLEANDWEAMLNYETEWMTRAQIVAVTYAAAEQLNDLKERYGRISPQRAAAVRGRLQAARAIRSQLAAGGPADPETRRALAQAIQAFSEGTLNDKAELFPPAVFWRNFRLGGIVRLLAQEALAVWRGGAGG
ncbi:MAG: radical SAM protein, partial [Anaerolineales bacterium]|nr:radical SAM protein [Anaerolineales bacterium]